MLEPRKGHAATVLQDGRVLVTGGSFHGSDPDDRRAIASVELYDPGTESWTAGPPLPVGLTGHHAIRLLDGRVLVFGGFTHPADHDAASDRSWLFDPTTSSWSEAGRLFPGFQADPLLLRDGRVLTYGSTTGGWFIPEAELWRFDPFDATWASVRGEPAVAGYPIAVLPDGSVLLIAWPEETDDHLSFSTRAWAYDAGTNTVTALPPSPFGFHAPAVATLDDGSILLVEPQGSVLYGPGAGAWDFEDTPRFVDEMWAIRPLADGRVLFLGATDCIGAVLPAVLLQTDTWVEQYAWGLANPIQSTITRLADGRILAAGGMPPCAGPGERFPPVGQTAAASILDPATIPPLDLD